MGFDVLSGSFGFARNILSFPLCFLLFNADGMPNRLYSSIVHLPNQIH